MVRRVGCSAQAWKILKTTFQAVSVASIDAKLSKLQSIKLQKREAIVAYWNRILELAGELESAGHKISELEKKRAVLRILTKEFEITAEAIIDGNFTYHEAVSKLIVRAVRLQESEDCAEKALLVHRKSKKCFACGKIGHMAKYCRKKKKPKRWVGINMIEM